MNKSFYFSFGLLTTSFAQMEANLRCLISGVAFKEDSVTASAFLYNSQLSNNIQILKKLSRLYIAEREQFESIIDDLHKIREERNLFVHGLWVPANWEQSPDNTAIVHDLKTHYSEEGDHQNWEHGTSKKYSKKDFIEIHKTVRSITERINVLMQNIQKAEGIEFRLMSVTSVVTKKLKLNSDES